MNSKIIKNISCKECGEELSFSSTFCPMCGKAVISVQELKPKKKLVAVLFAVFLGNVTFIYTYEKDQLRFWITLAATILSLLASTAGFVFMLFSVWVFSIATTVFRKQDWYANYGNSKNDSVTGSNASESKSVPVENSITTDDEELKVSLTSDAPSKPLDEEHSNEQSDLINKLSELKQAYELGLISKKEYETAKSKLI